jgi:hypothetical protein
MKIGSTEALYLTLVGAVAFLVGYMSGCAPTVVDRREHFSVNPSALRTAPRPSPSVFIPPVSP